MTEPTTDRPMYDEPSSTLVGPDPVRPPSPEPGVAAQPSRTETQPGPTPEARPQPATREPGRIETQPELAPEVGPQPATPEPARTEIQPELAPEAGPQPPPPKPGHPEPGYPEPNHPESAPHTGASDVPGAAAHTMPLPVELSPPGGAGDAQPPTAAPDRSKPGKHARGGGADRTPRAAGQGGTARKGLLAALVVLVLLLAALVAFLARLSITTRGAEPLELQRRDALAAARASSRVIFSYDYRHLSQDFAAGQAFTTGAFRTEYDTTTTKLVADVAMRYKGVAVADVSAAAVETASKNQVVALVFVNQQSSSTIQTTPKISQSRLEMTLVHTGGRWLVTKVKAL